METSTKPMVMALSIAQIVMAGAFFLLGLVDGFYIQFAHVSLTFLPCWIVALVGNILIEIYWATRRGLTLFRSLMYCYICIYYDL